MNILAASDQHFSTRMGLKKFTIAFFILITAVLPAIAQHDSTGLSTIISKTESFSTEHPFEKVYLHFDKPYYAAGDTIWFKAYLTAGPLHVPSGLSHIIYVDLIAKDSIVRSLKLPTINGVAFGDITLSTKDFREGNYHIRAYTNWMRNFGPDYFFNKTIAIGDARKSSPVPKISFATTQKNKMLLVNAKVTYRNRDGSFSVGKKVSWTVQNDDETISKGKGETDKNGVLNISFDASKLSSPETANLVTEAGNDAGNTSANTFSLKTLLEKADVQFFPEGGELIDGVRSKVAFKAINTNGIGIDVTGSVTDNSGNEVTVFTSRHAGMGIFALTPVTGQTYKAVVTFADGSKNTYDLPIVRTGGVMLAVNNSNPDTLGIKIAADSVFLKEFRNKSLYVVAQNSATIFYAGIITLHGRVYASNMPKSKFPTGVLQLTLFTADGEPLTERLVFIERNDAMDLTLTPDHPFYKARQEVNINIAAKNKTAPALGTFSVAVVDENKVPYNEDAETTILSSVLLTSDLRGYIEKPNYYFNHPDSQKLADLDVLMLTQGYRRFSWSNILSGKNQPITFLPEKGMTISGTLHTQTGVPVFKGVMNLRLPDRNISVNGVTDADGRFSFSDVSFYDSSKVVLHARTYERNNGLMIITDRPTFQPVTKNFDDPNAIVNIDSTLNVYLENSKKQFQSQHTLQEVVIKSTKIETFKHEPYSTLSGLSPFADQTLGAQQLQYCDFNIIACLESKVYGIWHDNTAFYFKRAYDAGNKTPIQFFLNGMAIDYSYLTNFHTEDVGMIEVYRTDGVSGINSLYHANGIISITTKSGSVSPKDAEKEKSPENDQLVTQGSSITMTPKGYYRARLFYSPKYTNQQGEGEMKPDLRSTIYWYPNIITDKNGNASFNYYNSDGRGSYRVVIEGIDNDGNIGRYVMHYDVR